MPIKNEWEHPNMTQINNDTEFRQSISQLDYNKQRELAGMFVNNVIGLCTDDRVGREG